MQQNTGLVSDLLQYSSDWAKLRPLNISNHGHDWQALGGILPQANGNLGFTQEQLRQFQLQNPSDPVHVLLDVWKSQISVATTAAFSAALVKIGRTDICDTLGLKYSKPTENTISEEELYALLKPVNANFPASNNWEVVAGALPQENSDPGFTMNALDQIKLEYPVEPIRGVLKAWLPQSTATGLALKKALVKANRCDLAWAKNWDTLILPKPKKRNYDNDITNNITLDKLLIGSELVYHYYVNGSVSGNIAKQMINVYWNPDEAAPSDVATHEWRSLAKEQLEQWLDKF